jgi:hypothetical protein
MNHIKKFENYTPDLNYSLEYYKKFKESDFPKTLTFSNPKATYKRVAFVPGSNKVFMDYRLDSKDPNRDNSYEGSIPEQVRFNFSVTYDMTDKKEKTKCFVKIEAGTLTWLEFDYEDGEIDYMDVKRAKLTTKSFSDIKKILKKYSI